MAFIQVFENPLFGANEQSLGSQNTKPRKKSAPQPPVQFINVRSLDDVGSAKSNQLVRSHVMKQNRKAGRRTAAAPAVDNVQAGLLPLNHPTARKSFKRKPSDGSAAILSSLDYLGDLRAALPSDSPQLFRCFETAVAPLQLPFRVKDGKRHPYVKEVVTAALSSEVLLNALLYATLVKRDRRLCDAEHERRLLQHRSKATRLLLSSFADPVEGTRDEAIAAVTLLAIFDLMVNGDVEAYDMHMTGLCDMTARRGGLDALGMSGALKISILWADQCRGTFMRRRPHFCVPPRPEDFPGVPLALAGYHGTRKMWRQGLVDIDLVEACEELNGLLGVVERNASGEDTGASPEFLLQKREELEGKLRSPRWDQQGNASLEVTVSICMRLYMAAILAQTPFGLETEAAMVQILAEQLRDSITSEMMDNESSQCLGFFLWVFFAGAFLEVQNSTRQWLLEESQPIVVRLATGGVALDGLKYLMMGYLWSEPFCDLQAEIYWQEALAMLDAQQAGRSGQ